MEKEDTGKFVFGFDEPVIDDGQIYQEQANNRLIEKLNLKIAVFSVLVPLVAAVFVAFAYIDLRNRISGTDISESLETVIPENQAAREIAVIEDQDGVFRAKLNVIIDERLSALGITDYLSGKGNAGTENSSGGNAAFEKEISRLNAELKSLKVENASLKKNLAALEGQNKKISAAITEISKSPKDSGSLKASNDALKQDVIRIKSDMVEKADLAAEMKKQKVLYQMELQELSAKIDKKLQAVKSGGTGVAR